MLHLITVTSSLLVCAFAESSVVGQVVVQETVAESSLFPTIMPVEHLARPSWLPYETQNTAGSSLPLDGTTVKPAVPLPSPALV